VGGCRPERREQKKEGGEKSPSVPKGFTLFSNIAAARGGGRKREKKKKNSGGYTAPGGGSAPDPSRQGFRNFALKGEKREKRERRTEPQEKIPINVSL